jgi:23S rRNA pseudouridine1911/1915/1917 synthase
VLKKFQFQITETTRKNRLDKFLYREINAVSRMYLYYLISDGKCTVDGRVENRGYHLLEGETVEIEIDTGADTTVLSESIPLSIVYEDAEILVINKPYGMLVHPTKGVRSGTLLNALNYYLNFTETGKPKPEKFIRAGLVHRLDKKTSGLMVVAKNPLAHKNLSRHFQRRLVEKKYYAVVEGRIKGDSGTINAPIGRNAEERFWYIAADGKPAESHFQVIERFADATLLELEPVTGRTNQLRLHCAYIGHPIIGDDKYGGREFERLCLHAYKLSFHHPNGNRRLEFETELPTDFPKFERTK